LRYLPTVRIGMLNLVIFGGTLRQGNYNGQVTDFVKQVVEQHSETWKVTVLKPQELNLTFENEGEAAKIPAISEVVAAADAYIIVTPEYNHGYPGSLKYLIDMHFAEYKFKPVSFVGVSDGPWGSVRAIEAWLPVVRTLNLLALKNDVKVSNCDTEIANGTFTEPEKWQRRIESLLSDLEFVAHSMKQGRETLG